jgi:hypothetical protein
VKSSYTYKCPKCGEMRSYAPGPSELVTCVRRARLNPEGRVVQAACPEGTVAAIVPVGGSK